MISASPSARSIGISRRRSRRRPTPIRATLSAWATRLRRHAKRRGCVCGSAGASDQAGGAVRRRAFRSLHERRSVHDAQVRHQVSGVRATRLACELCSRLPCAECGGVRHGRTRSVRQRARSGSLPQRRARAGRHGRRLFRVGGLITSPNPALKAEKSRSYTTGVVFQPAALTTFVLDFFEIKRTNEINTET